MTRALSLVGTFGPFVLLSLLSACADDDPCATYINRSCVVLDVRAEEIVEFDQLAIDSSALAVVNARTPEIASRLRRLPVRTAVLPPSEFSGAFDIAVGALRGGLSVARGSASSSVAPGQHVAVVVYVSTSMVAADGGVGDGGGDGGSADGGAQDGSQPDLAPPPPADQNCIGDNSWSSGMHTDPACDSRVLRTLPGSFFFLDRVALARTPTGRIGLTFYEELNFDEGQLNIVSFEDAPNSLINVQSIPSGTIGNQIGIDNAIAAGDDDKLHVAYLWATDQTEGTVYYSTLDATHALSTPETVIATTPPRMKLALAVAANHEIELGYFNPALSRLGVARKPSGGAWDVSTVLEDPTVASSLAGLGQIQMISDNGVILLAHHRAMTSTMSQGAYYEWNGATWGGRNSIGGIDFSERGYDVSVALRGTRRVGALFTVETPGADASAKLQSFDWVGTASATALPNDVETFTNFDSSDPPYRARIAIDPWGFVHIAYVARSSATSRALYYRREGPDGQGGKMWFTDQIVQSLSMFDTPLEMDFLLDQAGKPHFAYTVDGTIGYATRSDR